MPFIFKKPKGGYKPIRKVGDTKEETLRRLRAFLNTEEPRTVEFLVRFWQEQQAAISYADIQNMIADWQPSSAMLEQWRQEYAMLVNNQLAPGWRRTMSNAAADLHRRFPQFLYDPAVGAAQEYIRQRGAAWVTMFTNEQRDAVMAMIEQSAQYDAMTPEVLSRIMRPVVGLTKPQALANMRYWNAAWQSGINAGMSNRAAEQRADRMAATYAARQHRYRAMSIARTELAMAYNEGAFGATLAAQEQGYLGDVVKVWLTAADERVCPICAPLDGEQVNINAFFSSGKKLPPAHPQCRCAIAYIEITNSLQPNANGGIMNVGGNDMQDGENVWEFISGLDEQQRIDFFGGKTKAALFDAGLLAPEDYFKPLKDIDLSGIEIPDRVAIRHSTIGDFVAPSKNYRNGRLGGGGHTIDSMNEMKRRGIKFEITRISENGVMFGNVAEHRNKRKQTGNKQTWFPNTWTNYDITVAGISAANRGNTPSFNPNAREIIYKGVNVHVLVSSSGRIETISPSEDQ